LELYLKYYFYPGRYEYLINSDYNDLNIINDYTTRAKKRIFDMLKGNKTKEECNAWLLFEKSIPENFNRCKIIARQIVQRRKIQDDTLIKQITDSICVEYMINDVKRTLQEKQIKPNLILMTGFLGMKECVPTLQEKLQKTIATKKENKEKINILLTTNCDNEQAYRFALAKLGDKTQYQYILDTFISTRYFDKKFLSYFRDDKITWKYIDAVYYSKENFYDGDIYIPAILYTMDAICPYIKDLPKELQFKRSGTKVGDCKWAETLHEWLIKNRDDVKFDYYGKKDGYWSD
jgi:hypothetical protein